MLPLFITLFFLSIAGIVALVVKKLLQIEKLRTISDDESFYIDVPELEDVHRIFGHKIKVIGYKTLVVSIRGYLLGKHMAKKISKNILARLNHLLSKYKKNKTVHKTQKEASGFLKTISEYKKKVNKITDKIREEEGFEI